MMDDDDIDVYINGRRLSRSGEDLARWTLIRLIGIGVFLVGLVVYLVVES